MGLPVGLSRKMSTDGGGKLRKRRRRVFILFLGVPGSVVPHEGQNKDEHDRPSPISDTETSHITDPLLPCHTCSPCVLPCQRQDRHPDAVSLDEDPIGAVVVGGQLMQILEETGSGHQLEG